MGLLDLIRRKKKVDTLSLDSIKREELKLTVAENQKLSQLEKLEKEKKEKEDIFSKGLKIKSPARRRQLARLYEARSRNVGVLERELALLSKEITTTSAIRLAVERKQMKREGVAKLLSRISEADLVKILEDDKITSEAYLEKLNTILSTITEDASSIISEIGTEGQEIMRVWEKMDEGEIESVEDGIKEAEKAVKKTELE
ncbi:MAG: hypothetical protein A2W23_07030 [Planctomycetes bacterium RBG_16_43_13]|nr:MAG: hypothetical protein A2W23_07030 [Planctomycetes bacterium RBG_16_43_13]